MSTNATPAAVDPAVIIRRSLFFLVLIALTLGNLFTLFRGLEAPAAMDQAQIAREIARGNGFTTKCIRPAAYAQERAAKGTTIPFEKFEDTYHSPLNPLINAAVLKLVGADDSETWPIGKNEYIYPLDRVIATVRGWRDFARSRERLRALGRAGGEVAGEEAPSLPPGLEWWAENFALIRDVATRRYPFHMLSYESLLADPERTIAEVLAWLGVGDPGKASAVVHRGAGTGVPGGALDETGLEPVHMQVLDELHDHIHRGLALGPAFVERLNQTDRELRPRLLEHNAAVKAAALRELASGG